MKTSILGKYATLALFSISFISLNNCGNQSDSASDVKTEENGSASDFAILASPPAGYAVPLLQTLSIETNCNDGTDNDGDGRTDCMDTDCAIHPECSEWGPPLTDVINGRALTVYPNGILVPEDTAILKARGSDDRDLAYGLRTGFFATNQKDCWINPLYQDPYSFVGLGEALVAGPNGPVGPQLNPATSIAYYGPRRGLINECEFGTDIMFHHMDEDNGAGAGAGGDVNDEDSSADHE